MTTSFADARRAAHRLGCEHHTRTGSATEVVPSDAAHGRVLAAPIRARATVPPTDTSAMDGWAVSGPGPWTLDGAVRMGQGPGCPLPSGSARTITTGGSVPPGATAVLRSECGSVRADVLTQDPDGTPLRPGTDVRHAGEDVHRGDVVAQAGIRVSPAVVAAAAVVGTDEVEVVRAPRVTLVLIGDEVVLHGAPGPGQVRDAFGVSLPTVLEGLGLRVGAVEHLPDDREAVAHAVCTADTDLVVTTGGTGHGGCDHLVPALLATGATVTARGVAVRPGHPTVLARRRDGVPVLGLPGNPLAAMIALTALGLPLVAGLHGSPAPPLLPRSAGRAIAGSPATTRLVAVSDRARGVEPVPHQGPAMVHCLVGADAVAVVPAEGVPAGGTVEVLALPWHR